MSLNNKPKKRKGFSLIEVLVAMSLTTVALMGLIQLFLLGIAQNNRSDKMTNATFLAQQQIEQLRTFTADELNALTATLIDDLINTNQDTIVDFRRVTQVQISGFSWEIRVLVFAGAKTGVTVEDLIANPENYRVRTDVSTIISR